MSQPTRSAALELFKTYTTSESLTRHALSVEGVMRHFAEKFGEDPEVWGIIGLVHDIDYERYPDEHCKKAEEILSGAGWPEAWIRAVVSHGWGLVTDVKPETRLEQTLYAIDELTGLVASTALVRPSRSVMDMKAKSVKKKWKDKSFAAGVDRSIIEKGAEMLGMELSELITETILGMRKVADEVGLGMAQADNAE
ncbi:HDIG domain-containing metalloprotein [Desulfoluna spongiiphila]|uniref:HDIG domain-containing protein n=1 Tax=Desulfoluna spongiiphila TaxID=419481 RepID=A0A1G5HH69_9BACT|nr:HDIG domain-containing metalloprotein [Desulfoluna spongiiphila]SCY63133.1 HDIG domain-containing protein [Desulfoluna spongiiphila]